MITTDDAINKALEAVEVAKNQLSNCDDDMLDSAILSLSSAKAKLNALIARKKRGIE